MLLALVFAVAAVLNFLDRRSYRVADDGVTWIDVAGEVVALHVVPGTVGEEAGIVPGDRLRALDGKKIHNAVEVTQALVEMESGREVRYELNREGQRKQSTFVPTIESSSTPLRTGLGMVGILFLAIGLFVLWRGRERAGATHFYLFCLSFFTLLTFSYSKRFDLFDTAIYWVDSLAWSLGPALFLHFCLSFPARNRWGAAGRIPTVVVYAPGVILFGVRVLMALLAPSMLYLLDRVVMFYLVGFFVAGVILLEGARRQAAEPMVRQQLKWLSWGSAAALAPFAVLYAGPYSLGMIPSLWMEFAVLSLVLLPLTFAYAVFRYRLMDVDLLFRRGVVYSLATGTVVALYFALTAVVADVFREEGWITSRTGWVLAIVFTALIFRPVVRGMQRPVDRAFNCDRSADRRTLLDFARTLGSECRMEPLLAAILDRLSRTLDLERAAIFLVDPSTGKASLERTSGFAIPESLNLSFLNAIDDATDPGCRIEWNDPELLRSVSPPCGRTVKALGLQYYVPLAGRDRVLGYVGLGSTRSGEVLTSEDLELIRTLAGYFTIAVENAQLYESLERKAQQYEELREFDENILESVSTGVVVEDMARRVAYWNRAMEALYGLRREEVLGRGLGEFFSHDLIEELEVTTEFTETRSLYEYPLVAREGRRLTVNISVVPFRNKMGNVLGRLLIFNDITERVRLEGQVLQAEKLSSIGMLAAGVAHEVNTPLAVIGSQAQMLRKMVGPGDPKRGFLDKIVGQTFRASEIVNHLLKFSRTRGTEVEEVDFNRVVKETLVLVEHVLRSGRVTLECRLTPAPSSLRGNEGRLQQVLMNLILNARDAMPDGGKLSIRTLQENSSVVVEVEDTGVGIPTENLRSIYDPFFTTKSGGRGTGLGLAVSYGIVREHSGSFQVRSEPGHGTTFRLEFPATRKPIHV